MKKKGLWGMALLMLGVGLSGSEPVNKDQNSSPVAFENYTTIYYSYETSAEVKATPEELEKHLLETNGIFGNTKQIQFKNLSHQKIGQTGDYIEYETIIFGLPFRVKLLLIYYQPGEEYWFVTQKRQRGGGPTTVYRLKLSQEGQGTKLMGGWDTFQEKELSALAYKIMEWIKWPDMMAEVMDTGLANAQINFDPSLKKQELLKEGMRGKFNDVFYTGTRARVWIKASPEAVENFIADPENWRVWQEKYQVDFGKCWSVPEAEPCAMEFEYAGGLLKGNSFITDRETGYLSAYWAFANPEFIDWMRVFIKPASGGTELTFDLSVEPSSDITSPELVDFLLGDQGLKKTMGQILTDAKGQLESKP